MRGFIGVLFLYFAVVGLVATFSTVQMHGLTSVDADAAGPGAAPDLTSSHINATLRKPQPKAQSSSVQAVRAGTTPTDAAVPISLQSPIEEATKAYRTMVNASAAESCVERRHPIDLNIALSCLQKTTPSLHLEYPSDAEAHFREVRHALAPWAQHKEHRMHQAASYGGPWIENYWISHFEQEYDGNGTKLGKGACLSDIFGPFIPLFVPWVDLWVNNRHRYPSGLVDTLRSVLRPNVPYITVSQNDDGLPGRDPRLAMEVIPNVLVLSAGGYGHVPIPLLKQLETQRNDRSVEDRSLLLSYVGSIRNAPKKMRGKIHRELQELLNDRYQHYYGQNWRETMANSRFSLAPRGYGRTSYHVMEILQSGLIPVHVYSDTPWVPYWDLFVDKLGFVASADEMDTLVNRLNNVTEEDIERREETIVSLCQSHFSPEGVLEEIARFLHDNASDLRCRRLPPTARDA